MRVYVRRTKVLWANRWRNFRCRSQLSTVWTIMSSAYFHFIGPISQSGVHSCFPGSRIRRACRPHRKGSKGCDFLLYWRSCLVLRLASLVAVAQWPDCPSIFLWVGSSPLTSQPVRILFLLLVYYVNPKGLAAGLPISFFFIHQVLTSLDSIF